MSFGAPTVTGYSGFYDPRFSRAGNGAAVDYNSVPRYGRGGVEAAVARLLAKSGFRGMRRAMRVLNGASAGSAASETYSRVGTSDQTGPAGGNFGGARPIETVTAMSGNTTTAQRDYINNMMIDMRYAQNPTSYPVDLGGNGGGGKLGGV